VSNRAWQSDAIAVDFGGAGLWVWNADESNPEALARLLEQNGFQYFVVKAHDGTKSFRRNEPHIRAYAAAARGHRLAFGLWGHLTARNAAGEARFPADLVRKHHASFYLADAGGRR
jgi:alkanesulfonate monooxygenase SsuD/methylene tetrahydromethanopterin reductase-like flavin-dependent oxidoreductase (luciferase family)